jgi:SAM-dependent methyltransferase
MSEKAHWEHLYGSKPAEKLGWYEPHLQTSLRWIEDLQLAPDAPILDVGGGASTLVDDLLDAGHRSITVLDISEKALSSAKARLGRRAESVSWLVGDVTLVDMPTHYYLVWHDRALFHFLVSREQQQKYRDTLLRSLKPGGHLIIGSFAPEAPPMCSGLAVQRYSPEQLKSTLGDMFELQNHTKELHVTPGGTRQMFLYCHFHRIA